MRSLHYVLKMGPNQRVIKGEGVNSETGSSANDHLTMNSTRLALEAAPLQGMGVRTLVFLTMFAISMDSP